MSKEFDNQSEFQQFKENILLIFTGFGFQKSIQTSCKQLPVFFIVLANFAVNEKPIRLFDMQAKRCIKLIQIDE